MGSHDACAERVAEADRMPPTGSDADGDRQGLMTEQVIPGTARDDVDVALGMGGTGRRFRGAR